MTEATSGLCVTVGKYVIPTYKTSNDYEKLWDKVPFKWSELNDLQRKVDPNLDKCRDAVIIASGDTLSSREERMKAYLLPVFRNVTRTHRQIPKPHEPKGSSVSSEAKGYDNQPVHPEKQETGVIPKPISSTWEGPIAIIVCKSTSTCYEVDNVLKTIVSRGSVGHQGIRYGFRGTLPKSLINDPTKTPMKFDVLITTLPSFQWMLQTYRSKLMGSLRFLVFEELESFNDIDWDHLRYAFNTGNHFCSELCRKFTLTLVSAKWSLSLENMYTYLFNERDFTSIYFADQIQFAKYVSPKVNLRFYEDVDQKNLILIDMLKNVDEKERKKGIVVSCRGSSVDTVEGIVTKCTPLKSSRQTFTQGDVLILSDERSWNELEAQTFQVLLSFDGARLRQLRYLRLCQPSWHHEGSKRLMKRCPVQVTFLMDGEEPEFLQVYKATKELKGEMDGVLEEKGKLLLDEETRKKMLCTGILLYGYCNQVTSGTCGDRHELLPEDVAPEPIVACIGEIEFKVLYCTNPTLYSALIFGYFRTVQGKRMKVRDFSEEIKSYRERLNRLWRSLQLTRAEHFVKGGKYIAKETWKSNRIAEFIPVMLMNLESGPKNSYLCKVVSLETGEIHDVSGNVLWNCPPEETFGKLPDNATKLIYGNVSPPYGDREYGFADVTKATSLTNGKKFIGTIGMSLREFVWLRSMRDGTGKELKLQFPPQVGNNPNHLKSLICWVQKLGSAYPCHKLLNFDHTQAATHADFHTRKDGVQWRHLDVNEEPVKMKIRYVYDPSLFYGEYLKDNDLLKNLEKDLQSWAGRNLYTDLNVNEMRFFEDLDIGDIIALNAGRASCPSWVRAQICAKEGSIQNGFVFDVFSVDYGETVYEVGQQYCRPIRKELVTRLPFQTIAMELGNVSPVDEEWSEHASDYFVNLMLPEETGLTVAVVATEVLNDADVPSKYYKVVAVDKARNDIGALLVGRQLAKYTIDKGFTHALDLLMNAVKDRRTDEALNDSGLSCSEQEGWEIDVSAPSPENNFTSVYDANDFDVIIPPEKEIVKTQPPPKTQKPGVKKVLKKIPGKLSDSCKLSSKFKYTPTVFHHETMDEVVFTIQLADITDFKIEPEKTSRTICVSITNPPDYGFQLTLHGKVLPGPGTILTGQNLVIKYKKVISQMWPKLLQDSFNYRWLKSNYNQIAEDSSSENGSVSDNDNTQFCALSADDDSSDDEDIILKTDLLPLPNPDHDEDLSWL